jgi:hypothetical protein
MSAPAKPATAPGSRGVTPFLVFGVATVVAATWAVYQMIAWASVPSFGSSAWPTTIGIMIALAVFFILALVGPAND